MEKLFGRGLSIAEGTDKSLFFQSKRTKLLIGAAAFAVLSAMPASAQMLPTKGGDGGSSDAGYGIGGQSEANGPGDTGGMGEISDGASGGGGAGVPGGAGGALVLSTAGVGGAGGTHGQVVTTAGAITWANHAATNGVVGGKATSAAGCLFTICPTMNGGGGGAGGFGIVVTNSSGANTLNLAGSILGGNGGDGGASFWSGTAGGGGDGGYGIYFVSPNPGGTLTLAAGSIIAGGVGGNGGQANGLAYDGADDQPNDQGGAGGNGGIGLGVYGSSTSFFNINNAGTIRGGAGGTGGLRTDAKTSSAGVAANGGAAIFGGNLAITNSGSIIGGSGVLGDNPSSGAAAILNLFGNSLIVTNSGTIQGGNGGQNTYVGSGASAGAGIFSFGPMLLANNAGSIRGGTGGAASVVWYSHTNGATGGDGVVAGFASNLFVNGGTISGGNGGAGRTRSSSLPWGGTEYDNAPGGDGGSGISGNYVNVFVAGGTVTGGNGTDGGHGGNAIRGSNFSVALSAGTIKGGMSGASSPVQAAAIVFTGGTNALTLNGGTLQGDIVASSDQGANSITLTIGSGFNNGTLANNVLIGKQGTLIIQQSVNATISGRIGSSTGGGSLTVNNSNGAVITLSGGNGWSNSYTDGTTIIAGTLSEPYDNLGDWKSTLTLSGGTLAATGTFTSYHGVTLTAGTTSGLDVAAAQTLTVSGVIAGSGGLKKLDTGKLVLSETNVYTGLTEIVAGTLSNNGTIAGNILIDKGATYRGTGKALGTITNNGTIAPGNSPGTMTFGGAMVLGSGSALEFDIDGTGTGTGAGNYSRFVFQGPAATLTAAGTLNPLLRGITGSAGNAYTPPVGQRFNIVHTDAGIIGSFGAIVQPASGLATGTQFDAVYTATDIDLVVTPVSYANLAPLGIVDTTNRVSLGSSLNAYRLAPGLRMSGDQNAVLTALYSLPASSIAPAMDQIAGTVHGDALSQSLAMERALGRITGSDGMTAPLSKNTTLWLAAIGRWTSLASDGNAPGGMADLGGGVLGIDRIVSETARLGASVSYGSAEVKTNNAAAARITATRFAFHGDARRDAWLINFQFGLGIDRYASRRSLDFLARTAVGKATGYTSSAGLAVQYDAGSLRPFLAVDCASVHRSGFGETGAGDLSLLVASKSLSSASTTLGSDGEIALGSGISLSGRLAWEHDYGRVSGAIGGAISGLANVPFTARSSLQGLDAGELRLGLNDNLADNIAFNVSYEGEIRRRATSQGVQAGLRIDW